MAGFNEIFQASDSLSKLTSGQKLGVLDQVYDRMKEMPDITRGELREFRNQQMETLYEDAKDKGKTTAPNLDTWQKEMSQARPVEEDSWWKSTGGPSGMAQGIAPVTGASQEDIDTYKKVRDRNTAELMKDTAQVIFDNPAKIPLGMQKIGLDLLGMAANAGSTIATGAMNVMNSIGPYSSIDAFKPGQVFESGIKKWNEGALVQHVNNLYKENTKEDPVAYNNFHMFMTDMALGGLIGVGRLGRTSNAVRELRAGLAETSGEALVNPLTKLERLKVVGSPALSNGIGGQLFYPMDASLDAWMDDLGVDDAVKGGVKAASMLIGAAAIGGGVENIVNRIMMKDTPLATRVAALNKYWEPTVQPPKTLTTAPEGAAMVENVATQQAPQANFLQKVLENPELDAEIRSVANEMSIRANGTVDEALQEAVSKFNPSESIQELQNIIAGEAKLRAGQELLIEEAQAIRKRGANVRQVYSLSRDELDDLIAPFRPHRAEYLAEGANTPSGIPALREENLAEFQRGMARGRQADYSMQNRVEELLGREKPAEVAEAVPKAAPKAEAMPKAAEAVAEGVEREVVSPQGKRFNAIDVNRAFPSDIMGKARPTSKARKPIEIKSTPAQVVKRALATEDEVRAAQKTSGVTEVSTEELEGLREVAAQAAGLTPEVRIGMLREEHKDIQKQLSSLKDAHAKASPEERVALVNQANELMARQEQIVQKAQELGAIPKAKFQDRITRPVKDMQVRAEERVAPIQEPVVKPAIRETVSAKDVRTQMEGLTSGERINIERISYSLDRVLESNKGRALTEAERLDNLARVYNKPELWNGRVYEESSSLFSENVNTGERGISAGFLETHYPDIAKMLTLVRPEARSTGLFQPADVLGVAQGLVARSGPGMLREGWELSKPTIRQAQELWDEVRAFRPSAEVEVSARDLFKESLFVKGLNEKQTSALVESMDNAFGDILSTLVRTGDAEKARALSDSLARVVTMGTSEADLRVLTHELGHQYFWNVMEADERMAYLETMRKVCEDEGLELWKMSFPGYARKFENLQKMAAEGKIDVERAQMEVNQLLNPSEMFAEQYRAFTFDQVLPSFETLQSMGRLQHNWKNYFKEAQVDFERLTPDTKKFFLNTIARPDVERARKIPMSEIEGSLHGNFMFTRDIESTRARIMENEAYFQEIYGQRGMEAGQVQGVGISNIGKDAQGNAIVTPSTSIENSFGNQGLIIDFNALPAAQKVEMFGQNLDDLLRYAETESLKAYHNGDLSAIEGMTKALNRADYILAPEKRGALIDSMTKRRMAPESESNLIDSSGQYMELSTGRRLALNESEDAQQMMRAEEAKSRSVRQVYAEQAELYVKILDDISPEDAAVLRTLDPLSSEFMQAASRVLKKEGEIAREFNNFYNFQKLREALQRLEDADTWGGRWREESSVRSAVRNELAALDVRNEALRQMANGAMAKTGLGTFYDGAFSQALYSAEQFSSLWSKPGLAQGGWRQYASYETMLSVAARAGFIGLAGLEYDPNGVYIPGFGHATFSFRKAFESPLMAFMVPGLWPAARFVGKASKKPLMLGGKKMWSQLPDSIRKQAEDLATEMTSLTKALLHPTGGVGQDVSDIFSQSKMASAKAQKRFRDFAELFAQNFSKGERAAAWRVLTGQKGAEHLEKWMRTSRKDLWEATELTKIVMNNTKSEFEKLGVISPLMRDSSEGGWLHAYIDDLTKTRSGKMAVLEKANISAIKGAFLRGNQVPWEIRNKRVNGSLTNSETDFRIACANEGITLDPGTHINSYRGPDKLYYAVEGSALDSKFKQVYKPDFVWSNKGEGYTLIEAPQGAGPIRLSREHTVGERKALGQSFDISANLARTAELMGKDFRNARIYQGIFDSDHCISPNKTLNPIGEPGNPGGKATWDIARKNAEFFNQNWVYVPETIDKHTGIQKYGRLAGSYVDRETFDAIRFMDGMGIKTAIENSWAAPLLHAHQALLRGFKMAKTVYTPTAHLNNFVSNLFMGTMLGHNVLKELAIGHQCVRFRKQELKALELMKSGKGQEAQAIYSELRKKPLYKKYQMVKDAQMADSTMWANEIRSNEYYENFLGLAEDKYKGAWGKVKQGHDFLKTRSARAYENGDLRFKMGAFITAMDNGMDAQQALRYAYEAYFDYGTLSPGAKMLRDTGIFPFVSYMYKAFPAMAKAFKEHPGRVAAVLGGLELANIASYNAEFSDGEALKHREDVEDALPSYINKKGLFGLARTSLFMGIDEKSRLKTFDITRMLGGGDWGETVSTPSTNGVDWEMLSPGRLLGSLLNQAPLFALMAEYTTGVNPALKTPTVRGGSTSIKHDNIDERHTNAMAHKIWNTIVPNLPFIPYTYSSEAIVEGLMGAGVPFPSFADYDKTGLDRSGVAKPLGGALASSVGIKTRSYDLKGEKKRQKASTQQENTEKARLKKIKKSPEYSKEYKAEQKEKVNQILKDNREFRSRQQKAVRRLLNDKRRESGGSALPPSGT